MIVAADKFESFAQVSSAMTFPEFSRLAQKYPERATDIDLRYSSERQAVYLWLREVRKLDHTFAAMLACRSAPKANTDREYLEGRHNWAADVAAKGQDATPLIKQAAANAKAMGMSPPSDTAVYEPGLAEFPLDPRAFLTGGRNELRRKCEANHLDCDGPVKVRAHRGQKEVKAGTLGADLTNELISQKIKANPDLARKSKRELVESVRHDHQYNDSRLVESPALPSGFRPFKRKSKRK